MLAPGAEIAPTLAAPQEGSTALTGNGRQGIYVDFDGVTFISNGGALMYRDSTQWVFGAIQGIGADWSFHPSTISKSIIGTGLDLVTGSGSFEARKSMAGQYSVGGRTAKRWGRLNYALENALAVTQDSMAGEWSSTSDTGFGMSIKIDSTGKVTGTTAGDKFGVCSLTGTVVQSEPSTSRNLFSVKLNAMNAATGTSKACELEQIGEYSGLGAVILIPVSMFPEEGARRAFHFHAFANTGAALTNTLNRR